MKKSFKCADLSMVKELNTLLFQLKQCSNRLPDSNPDSDYTVWGRVICRAFLFKDVQGNWPASIFWTSKRQNEVLYSPFSSVPTLIWSRTSSSIIATSNATVLRAHQKATEDMDQAGVSNFLQKNDDAVSFRGHQRTFDVLFHHDVFSTFRSHDDLD